MNTTKIDKRTLRSIYAISKQINMESALNIHVRQQTDGRTDRLGSMMQFEADDLLGLLKEERKIQCGAMWGKIIYLMTQMGYINKKGTADYTAINKFIQNIGSNNPRKVVMAFLTPSECGAVLTQVKARYKTFMESQVVER